MKSGSVPENQARPAGVLRQEMYFPTCIYFSDLPDAAALNATLRPHIYAWRDEDREGLTRSNVREAGTWHSATSMATRPEFRSLVARIITTAREVFDSLGYHSAWRPWVANMWANIAPRYGFNRGHSHPSCLWSGVYYVQVPERAGRLYFLEPRAQALVLEPVYERALADRPESWREVYFEPLEGRIILFPAWLVHEVEPNMSETEGPAGDRISVSFNIVQRQNPRLSKN